MSYTEKIKDGIITFPDGSSTTIEKHKPVVFKTSIDQAKSMQKTPSLRDRFNRYLNNGFSGSDIDYWNEEIIDIENELPFENDEEHNKWLDLGSIWTGQAEWPQLTEKIIKRGEDYMLAPEQVRELKSKFKGKDYAEAMKRWMGGEAFRDILSGLIPYEK